MHFEIFEIELRHKKSYETYFLLSRYYPQALRFPKIQSVGVDRIKKNSAGVVLLCNAVVLSMVRTIKAISISIRFNSYHRSYCGYRNVLLGTAGIHPHWYLVFGTPDLSIQSINATGSWISMDFVVTSFFDLKLSRNFIVDALASL